MHTRYLILVVNSIFRLGLRSGIATSAKFHLADSRISLLNNKLRYSLSAMLSCEVHHACLGFLVEPIGVAIVKLNLTLPQEHTV